MTPSQSERPRDWIAEAHLIARASAGLGHPFDLTIAEFDRHLALAVTGYQGPADTGKDWMRSHVERSRR
jgi:hypothetical protein